MIRTILTVFILALGASAILAITDFFTKDKINLNREKLKHRMRNDLLTENGLNADEISLKNETSCKKWQIREVIVQGYSGPIQSLALIRTEKDITLSLRVTKHSETPGIGDFIEHKKNNWMKELDNLTSRDWANLDMVSGSTITSKAIKKSAEKAFRTSGESCEIQ